MGRNNERGGSEPVIQVGEVYELDGARYLVNAILEQPDRAQLRYEDDEEFKESGQWLFMVPFSALYGKKAK